MGELLFVLAMVVLISLMWLALRWRRMAIEWRAVCKDQQKTIYMQECELLEARVLKINQEHRAAKKAML